MMLFSLLLAVLTQPQARLSDEQIDQVIAYAQTAEGFGGARCYATTSHTNRSATGGGFAVSLEGPAGRIFEAVKAARNSGHAFARGDVTSDMAATTLTVVAYPETPTQDAEGWHYPPRATGVVIRAGGPERIVVQPRRTEPVPVRWRDTSGATAGQGLRATFDYQDFARIHLGDFELVVLSDHGERRCTIDTNARASIH